MPPLPFFHPALQGLRALLCGFAQIFLQQHPGCGALVLLAIFSMAASRSAITFSRAGLKCSTWTLSKGGTPPYGPVQGWSKGFVSLDNGAVVGLFNVVCIGP